MIPGVNSDKRNRHDLPVRQIMTLVAIGVYIEMRITHWTLGPGDGSGPIVLEAEIPTFLHIRELSTTGSLSLFGRGSAVGRPGHGFCPSDMYGVGVCVVIQVTCFLRVACLYPGKSAQKVTQVFTSDGYGLGLLFKHLLL